MKKCAMGFIGGVLLGSIGSMHSMPAAAMPAADLVGAADGTATGFYKIAYRVRPAGRPAYAFPRITYGSGELWWYTPPRPGLSSPTWGPGAGWYRPAWSPSGWYGPRWFGGGFGPKPWGYRESW
jgi:hypothetical protein